MRVFVLALDGLDYRLVKRLRLRNLMQTSFGALKVPTTSEGYAMSPEVWATFLVGKRVTKEFKRHPLVSLLVELRKIIRLSFGIGQRVKRLVEPRTHYPYLDYDTFLNHIDAYVYNFPYVNYDNLVFDILHNFNRGVPLDRTVELLYKLYRLRKEVILRLTKRNEKLVLAYMHFPDVIQHLLFRRKGKIYRLYYDINRFILKLSENINGKFLIISDHGFDFKRGIHSGYGFYSINDDVKFRHILDVRKFILDLVS